VVIGNYLHALTRLVLLLILAYLAVCALMYAFQERLLFFPRANDADVATVLAPWQSSIQTDDIRLQGWIVSPPMPGVRPLIYYFGGNAEDVSHLALKAVQLGGLNLVVMNYRGYGGSGGSPGERELFADALAIFDATSKRFPNNGQIVAMGRSLGTGVAVHLATQRPVDALILISPYDSIAAVAQEHYPILPVGPLLKHRFASVERADELSIPALFLVAEVDRVVPLHRTRALAEAWAGPVTWRQLPGTTHNSVHAHPDYWKTILDFLRER
jgi:pimeloyl-ACP methyl ester carboxylesterase